MTNPSTHTGGGGTHTAGNPNLYDILLPPGEDQEKTLGAYRTDSLVKLPMVGK